MNEDRAIIEKIISDAQKAADAAVLNARDVADQAKRGAAESTEKFISETVISAKNDGEKLFERRVTLARLDAKRAVLSCKQGLVENVFDHAERLLMKMPKDKYEAFVCRMLEEYAECGDLVKLSVNAPFSAEELSACPVFKDKRLRCEKDGNFSGGIIVVGQKRDADLTFKACLRQYADKYYAEVAHALFNENE